MDEREAAWTAVNEALPARWRLGLPAEAVLTGRWSANPAPSPGDSDIGTVVAEIGWPAALTLFAAMMAFEGIHTAIP